MEDLGVAYGVSSSSQRLQPAVTTVVELAHTRQQTSLVQQLRLLSRSTDRPAVSKAPFVGHVVDCRTLEMTHEGEKVPMRDQLLRYK